MRFCASLVSYSLNMHDLIGANAIDRQRTCKVEKAYIQPVVIQLLPADSEDITRARLNFDIDARSLAR